MLKIQSDRQEDIQVARQTDRVTEKQNDIMAYSRAAKEPALVQLGTSSMNSKVTGEGDEEVKKKTLQFSAINSDF